MAKTSVKGKGKSVKGKGLTKKVGPLPLYVYLIGVAVVLFYLYTRHRSGSNSASDQFNGSLNQQTIPSGVVIPSSTSGVSEPTGQGSDSSITFPNDYVTQTDLSNAVDSLSSQTAADIASITFPQPTINITVPHDAVRSTTTKSKTAAKKAVTPPSKVRYYTLKKKVPLRAGQTLHFARGKGYYAA